MPTPVWLLDASVVIPVAVPDHVHHDVARHWFSQVPGFATCPTVQGSLVRYLVRQGISAPSSLRGVETFTRQPRHEQWFDDVTYLRVDMTRVVGHAQVTDAYLAQLARVHGGRVATFDRGFAAMAPDVVDLVTDLSGR